MSTNDEQDTLQDRMDVIGDSPRAHLFSAELLSTQPDHELQSLVEAAARVADTPIAIVTMLTDHLQIFRAHTGLADEEKATLATDRDISFCQQVVAWDAPFETNDASADRRVPQTLVKALGLTSYYGVPIRSQQGTLGTLCVIDVTPRGFTDTQRAELAALGRLVERRLEQLRSSRRIRSSTEPTFAELRNLLTPMMMSIDTLEVSLAEVQAFQRYTNASQRPHTRSPMMDSGDAVLADLVDEVRAITEHFDALVVNIDALQDATCETGSDCSLWRVLSNVQTLTHHLTKVSGGLTVERPASDTTIAAPLTEVISTICVAVNLGAKRMLDTSRLVHATLSVDVDQDASRVRFDIRAEGYTPDDLDEIERHILEVIPSKSWQISTREGRGISLSIPTTSE